jgi:sugar-specific transcriptional regulator TrmB
MTYSVDAIEGVRNAANERAAKLPEKSPLRAQLKQLAAKCEELRSKIVATKEGGAITGEERIRELLGQVYGAVNNYEGRPTEYQAARADSLAHELEDVISDFQKLTQKELPAVNTGLRKAKLEAISVLTEADWKKKREGEGGPGAGSGMRLAGGAMWERD